MGKIAILSLVALLSVVPLHAATHTPTTSAELQQALSTAACGDTISLAPRAVYQTSEGFIFTRDCATNPIVVTTNTTLPAICDMRFAACVSSFRSYALANFANLQVTSANMPAIYSVNAAKGWIFRGVIVSTSKTVRDGTGSELFGLGWDANRAQVTTDANLPDGIELDRFLVTGTPTGDSWRGVGANGKNIQLKNGIIEEIHGVGIETQCVAIWNGPGPVHGENLYLSCATENWLSGGAIGGITGSKPSGSLRNSHLTKKLEWKADHPSYAGIPWAVKNVFEIKNGINWVITGNIIERSWTMAQVGFCVLFTLSGDGGSWADLSNIRFENNIVRHCNAGFQLRMSDDTHYNGNHVIGDGMIIRNNLIDDISGTRWGLGSPAGYVWLYGGGGKNQVIEHNTMNNEGRTGSMLESVNKRENPIWRNNLSRCGTGFYSCWHSSEGGNKAAFDAWTTGYTYTSNVHFADEPQAPLPIGNTLVPQSTFASQFQNSASGNYRLVETSFYKRKGTDGLDIGVSDWSLLPPIDEATPPPPPPPPPPPDPTPTPTPPPTPSPTCTYTVTPAAVTFSRSGGMGSIGISTQSGCGWTATSDQTWLTLVHVSGAGSASITYRVKSYNGRPPRLARLHVAGQTVTITEHGK